MYRQSVILRGNNIYRFNLCNEKGNAVIRVYDTSTMLLSSYDPKTKNEYDPINFLCRKTGQYLIVVTEQSGKAMEAVGIMSHVTK
jgi:lysyl-tRNA synthetase class I